MYRVEKRDKRIVDFDINKIKQAIIKAFRDAKCQSHPSIIDLIATQVTSDFSNKIIDDVIKVEDIQDSVENVLMKAGYTSVAKVYIEYRQQHAKLRELKSTVLDYKKLVDSYLKVADWRVAENSTVTYSVGGLILSNSGAVTANYWLSEVYDREIAQAHKNADIHIHDLSMLTGYCAGWSLKQLIKEGLGGVPGKITSKPASHLTTLCNQMVNFLGIMQNEWAGAQAFSSFDTYLAPFVKVDNLTYSQVKQCIQSFIFGINVPSRWGTQAPFSNITLDWTVPDDLAELPAIVGGKDLDFCYKDCKKEMDMINKAFIETMIEGDANGRGFQYPIPTYSITRDFDWSETENNRLLFEMTAKYGTPYFSNYVNSDMEPNDVRSMCVLPNTMVWARRGNKTIHCTIEDLYNNYAVEDIKILTKYGYRDLKEMQRFEYQGDMLQFTTEQGKVLTTTPDHEHVVYDEECLGDTWFTDGSIKRKMPWNTNLPGWEKLGDKSPSYQQRKKSLVKKKASEVRVGDYFSCRHVNPGELRKGLTYDEYYGAERSAELRSLQSDIRRGQEAWNKGIPHTVEARKKISAGLMGHYVSENCKIKSSERWLGNKNPKRVGGMFQEGYINCSISPREWDFVKELDALGVEYKHQYVIATPERSYVADFYIPESNLLIELETNYPESRCMYNDFTDLTVARLRTRYELFRDMGYNVLVFNPDLDDVSYRPYINNSDRIVDITPISYNGYVYDVEVDCTDVEGDVTFYHTFYANEILTGNCCRLRLDLRQLRKKSGGFFGSGESTGSVGVVTINMPRIAYLAKDEKDFYDRLAHMMDIAARSLKIKRQTITKFLEEGLYPYTKRYLGTFNNHFSTIGLVGMNEACLNAKWLREDLTKKEAQDFTKDVLNFMRNKLSDYQEQYGDLYNLEATPAESTSYRLAKHDVEKYPDIITASSGTTPYYTNSSHLPVGFTSDIFEALDIQDELQTLYTSGTVFHAFLGEKLPTWKSAANLVKKIAENYRLPYYTMSPTYSVCKDHGYLAGEQDKCPICGNPTEVYSRITGYYRPVQNWNAGKKAEYANRVTYDISETHSGCKECTFDGLRSPANQSIPESLETSEKTAQSIEGASLLLFTTKTCPNCKMAKMFMEKSGLKYTVIDVEENIDLVNQYNISRAPTLVDLSTNIMYDNASKIKAFIASMQ